MMTIMSARRFNFPCGYINHLLEERNRKPKAKRPNVENKHGIVKVNKQMNKQITKWQKTPNKTKQKNKQRIQAKQVDVGR